VSRVHARHDDVEQDEVGARFHLGRAQCLLAAGGDAHVVVVAQQAGDQAQRFGIVVDGEDGRAEDFVLMRCHHPSPNDVPCRALNAES
jgi:hypothetical protein